MKSSEVRSQVNHPIIDADGHIVEITPLLAEYIGQVGGAAAGAEFEKRIGTAISSYPFALRQEHWLPKPPFWTVPAANTVDRMTVALPRLLRHRMDALGLDYSVLFPTIGMSFLIGRANPEMEAVCCRAYNMMVAEQYADQSDRMTPAAVIPMHMPDMACEELEYAASRGLRVALFPAFVRRVIPGVEQVNPGLAHRFPRLDFFGLDSQHNYDKVWAKCVELGFPVMLHSFAIGFSDRVSPTNYMNNHMGMFAAAQEAACRALFLGGVTRRFPTLRFGFLEGGVSWGSRLVNDLATHWSKRNIKSLKSSLLPSLIDLDVAEYLCREYGPPFVRENSKRVAQSLLNLNAGPVPPDEQDEFAHCKMESVQDLQHLYSDRFYFGCEADDPLVSIAFKPELHPNAVKLKALFGSDMGHWDVVDVEHVVAESYELVERGLISAEDYRSFTCDNAYTLFTSQNADFFAGTSVEGYRPLT
jgi:predicted TIM-barrel fold metal-dependent hydrolase